MQFNPKPGDTIVTAARGNYICVTEKNSYYGNADFYGERKEDTGWGGWMHDGRTESEFNDPSRFFKIFMMHIV